MVCEIQGAPLFAPLQDDCTAFSNEDAYLEALKSIIQEGEYTPPASLSWKRMPEGTIIYVEEKALPGFRLFDAAAWWQRSWGLYVEALIGVPLRKHQGSEGVRQAQSACDLALEQQGLSNQEHFS